jgi:zinc protease
MAAKELFAAVKGLPPRVATPASVMGLTLNDVRVFHRDMYGPTGATVIVAGNVTAEEGERIAHAIVDGWTPQTGTFLIGAPASSAPSTQPSTRASTEPSTEPSTPADAPVQIVLVDRPGAVQCTVRMIAPAFDAQSDQRWAGAVAGQILGEGLWSRLGRFVRTERGYVYVASARFVPLHDDGYFLGSCDTDAAEIPATLSAVLGQIAAMRDGSVNDQELAEAKSALAARRIVGDEGAHQRAARELARETTLGVPTKAGDSDRALGADDDEHAADYDERVRAVSAADVQAVMRDYARPEKMTIVIVGPADALEASLQPLGVVRVVR